MNLENPDPLIAQYNVSSCLNPVHNCMNLRFFFHLRFNSSTIPGMM